MLESFRGACFIYSHIKTTEAEPSADEHIYIQLFRIKAERSVLLWKVKVTAIGRLRPTCSNWCQRRGGLVSRVVMEEIREMKCDWVVCCRTKTWRRRSESLRTGSCPEAELLLLPGGRNTNAHRAHRKSLEERVMIKSDDVIADLLTVSE